MNGSLAMRSTRLRTLLLILVGGGMLLSLYLLTSSQYHLKDVRHLLDACQQQKDSLLAQLQVVYEQKNRVEKYLQQEKLDHKKTQDDNQKNNYLRLQVQKAKTEVDTKLSDLQKEQLSLQERYRDLESQTKDLQEQQSQREEKQAKMQADYDQSLHAREEENKLLHGNLSLALHEKERLENQVVQLNNNIQQLKMDFFNYKRMYTEINQRLKKLTEQNNGNAVRLAAAVADEPAGGKVADTAQEGNQKVDQTLQTSQPAQQVDAHHHQAAEDAHMQQQVPVGEVGAGQHGADQRRPLAPPHIVSPKVTESAKGVAEETSAAAADPTKEPKVEEGAGNQAAPPSGLRQQLQPPDFGQPQPEHEEANSVVLSSPGPLAGGNQPLLPPPPPQDSKQAPEAPQLDVDPPGQQGEPVVKQDLVGGGGGALQSQEQRDQDTMARKPILEQHPPGAGGGVLVGQDLRAHDNMFLGAGGAPPWNPFGELDPLARPQQPQQQIKSPELKPRPNNNNNVNNNNNNRHQEDDDNYPEDADDDNAEEQDDTGRDRNLKPFQDHDFEDNDGNDHNQAKEEGIVIAPK